MSHAHSSPAGAPSRVETTLSIEELEQIPVLPEYSSSDAAARAERRAAERKQRREREQPKAGRPQTVAPRAYLALYGKYVALFVGAGLISGAVVHYPLDPGRYLLIGAAGALLFAGASAVHEARERMTGAAELVQFVAASLVLALGIGMISGGIQHFSDIPARAATLIPLGAALSLVAFAVRDGHRLDVAHVRRVGGAIAAALVVLGLVLAQVAAGMKVPAEGSHSHASPATEPAAAELPASTPTRSQTTAPAGAAAHTESAAPAGHEGHTH